MSGENEQERAARKFREWQAAKAEAEAANAAAEMAAEQRRVAILQERVEDYGESRASYSIGTLAAVFVVAGLGLVALERYFIIDRAAACMNAGQSRGQENCASTIADSNWWWLLPSEYRDAIRVAQEFNR